MYMYMYMYIHTYIYIYIQIAATTAKRRSQVFGFSMIEPQQGRKLSRKRNPNQSPQLQKPEPQRGLWRKLLRNRSAFLHTKTMAMVGDCSHIISDAALSCRWSLREEQSSRKHQICATSSGPADNFVTKLAAEGTIQENVNDSFITEHRTRKHFIQLCNTCLVFVRLMSSKNIFSQWPSCYHTPSHHDVNWTT